MAVREPFPAYETPVSDENAKSETVAEGHPVNSTKSMNAESVTHSLVGRAIDNGKYIIEELIGEGGMGKVYRGRNTRTESPVAIKTLMPNLVQDDSLVQRFEVEAKAASNLSHPNTISIYDFGREGDVLFMVMELLTGESLDALITREKPLAADQLVQIIRQVCKSLDEAHSAGLVHRDIKPDNIFLNRVQGQDEDHVKVLDFGVAKLQDNQFGNSTLTQAGMIFGTPRYMSPEQARAFPLDGRSDIYALGVIMYEALTGSPPFIADDPVGVLIKHVNEEPKKFRVMNPAAPLVPELEAIVRRCMAKDPDDRFDDAKTLLNALSGQWATGPTVSTAGERIGGLSPTQTITLPDPSLHTSANIASDAFDSLGISSGHHDDLSQYTLGATAGQPESRVHESESGRRSLLRVGLGISVLVVISAVALANLVGNNGGEMTPSPEIVVAFEDNPVPSMAVGPIVEIAFHDFGEAVQSARETASARVVTIELVAEPAEAAAQAQVDGDDDPAVPLPHTFVFTRDPNSPSAQLRFVVTAEGYVDAEVEAPLAATDEPISVRLHRQGSGSPSGRRVLIPERSERNGRNPYER